MPELAVGARADAVHVAGPSEEQDVRLAERHLLGRARLGAELQPLRREEEAVGRERAGLRCAPPDRAAEEDLAEPADDRGLLRAAGERRAGHVSDGLHALRAQLLEQLRAAQRRLAVAELPPAAVPPGVQLAITAQRRAVLVAGRDAREGQLGLLQLARLLVAVVVTVAELPVLAAAPAVQAAVEAERQRVLAAAGDRHHLHRGQRSANLCRERLLPADAGQLVAQLPVLV